MADEELVELIEMDVRELLSANGFDGDNAPIIKGSALKALEGDEKYEDAIMELVDAMDSYIEEPVRDMDKPFLMPIEDVFSIKGRGTVATGRIEQGVVKLNDEVEIVGLRPSQKQLLLVSKPSKNLLTKVKQVTTLVFFFVVLTEIKSNVDKLLLLLAQLLHTQNLKLKFIS